LAEFTPLYSCKLVATHTCTYSSCLVFGGTKPI